MCHILLFYKDHVGNGSTTPDPDADSCRCVLARHTVAFMQSGQGPRTAGPTAITRYPEESLSVKVPTSKSAKQLSKQHNVWTTEHFADLFAVTGKSHPFVTFDFQEHPGGPNSKTA